MYVYIYIYICFFIVLPLFWTKHMSYPVGIVSHSIPPDSIDLPPTENSPIQSMDLSFWCCNCLPYGKLLHKYVTSTCYQRIFRPCSSLQTLSHYQRLQLFGRHRVWLYGWYGDRHLNSWHIMGLFQSLFWHHRRLHHD